MEACVLAGGAGKDLWDAVGRTDPGRCGKVDSITPDEGDQAAPLGTKIAGQTMSGIAQNIAADLGLGRSRLGTETQDEEEPGRKEADDAVLEVRSDSIQIWAGTHCVEQSVCRGISGSGVRNGERKFRAPEGSGLLFVARKPEHPRLLICCWTWILPVKACRSGKTSPQDSRGAEAEHRFRGGTGSRLVTEPGGGDREDNCVLSRGVRWWWSMVITEFGSSIWQVAYADRLRSIAGISEASSRLGMGDKMMAESRMRLAGSRYGVLPGFSA